MKSPSQFTSPLRRMLKFRMRTLLAAFVVVAVFLVFARSHLIPWHKERSQIKSVLNTGGQVFEEPVENLFACQLLGESISNRAVSVFLRNPSVTDEWLQNVSDLTHCRVLGIQSKNVSDRGLQHLAEMKQLQRLHLTDTSVTDEGLDHLWNSMPELRFVLVDGKEYWREGTH